MKKAKQAIHRFIRNNFYEERRMYGNLERDENYGVKFTESTPDEYANLLIIYYEPKFWWQKIKFV